MEDTLEIGSIRRNVGPLVSSVESNQRELTETEVSVLLLCYNFCCLRLYPGFP